MKGFFLSLFIIMVPFISLKAEEGTFYKSNPWGEKVELTKDKNHTWVLEERKEKFFLFYKGELFYSFTQKISPNGEIEETYLYPTGKKRIKTLKENNLKEDFYIFSTGRELKTNFIYEENNLKSYKRDSTKIIEKDPWNRISLLEEEGKKIFFQKENLYSFFPSRIKHWIWQPSSHIEIFSLKGNLLKREINYIKNNGSREKLIQKEDLQINQTYSSLGLKEKEIIASQELIFSRKWLWSPSLLVISYEEIEGNSIKKVTFNYEDNKIITESIFLNNQLRQIINWEEEGKRIENFNKKGESLGVFFLPKE